MGLVYIRDLLEEKLRKLCELYEKKTLEELGQKSKYSISDVIEDLIRFRENSGQGE